jgi:hypothetical protein
MNNKLIFLLILLIVLLSGCIYNNQTKIKIDDNSNKIDVNKSFVENSDIIEHNKFANTTTDYKSIENKISDERLNITIVTNGTESGCLYHYNKPNKLELNGTILKFDTIYTEVKKQKHSVMMNCAEYARKIIVKQTIIIEGQDLKSTDYINISQGEMGPDKSIHLSD